MGIVSEPWGEGKDLVATNDRDTSGDRGWTEGQGRQSGPPEGRRRPEGTHAAAPPCGAGHGRDGQTDRRRGPHEVSRAGVGRWPGRKTATTRRRPAWHTGHCSMSTPVTRSMRAATGSGAAGVSGGRAARGARHRASLAAWARLGGARSGGSACALHADRCARSRRGGRAGGSGEGTRRPGASSSSGGSPRV